MIPTVDDVLVDAIKYRILKHMLEKQDTGRRAYPYRPPRVRTLDEDMAEVVIPKVVPVYEWRGFFSAGNCTLDQACEAVLHSVNPEQKALVRHILSDLGLRVD